MNNHDSHRSSRWIIRGNYYLITLIQAFIPLFLLWLSGPVFGLINADLCVNPTFSQIMALSAASIPFCMLAWSYFNMLFVLMRFLPFEFVLNKVYLLTTNIIYVVCNSLMLILAYADIPYFRFTGARMRFSNLSDLFTDPNLGGIIFSYIPDFWWAFLLVFALIALIAWAAFGMRPAGGLINCRRPIAGWLSRIALLIVAVGFMACSMRGRFGPGHPLAIGDAVWLVDEAPHTNVVLNTPFCILRSMKGDNRVEMIEFFPENRLGQIRQSIHDPRPGVQFNPMNVMVIVVESGGQLWSDSLSTVPGVKPQGLMPFVDSLASKSYSFRQTFTTGIRSIEGLTSIFGGFPTFGEMLYMPSPYSANVVDAMPALLTEKGYDSRFYFGGNHGSFNIDQLACAMGFSSVADRATYNDDSDYDGVWGIYDDAMGRYVANDISNLKQPFVAAWFTLSLHGPFNTPKNWKESNPLSKEKGPSAARNIPTLL